MAGTRTRALEAALALVGEEGIRALTHARVDERAGLPRGSTSNWFRTREALLAGTVEWLARSEQADLGSAGMPQTVEHLVDAFCAMIATETGPFAARTRARFALFLEGSLHPEVLEPLRRQRAEYVQWTAHLLAAVGAEHPTDASRTFMAAADGLVLHRLTIDPDIEIRPVVERAVRACLR